MKKIFILLLGFYITCYQLSAQKDTIVLWPDGAPGALGKDAADIPLIICYPAKNNPTHAAVLVCPGGGYATLAMDHEGVQIAEWYNSIGVSAYILKYRVNTWDHKKYGYPWAFRDASRAMRYIKYKSAGWNLDSAKIGIMGFSAGGHLVSTVGTHFDSDNSGATDPIDKLSARPAFMILCYPVISMKAPYMHSGSRENLVGKSPDSTLLISVSNETQVKPNTPPTFIFQTNEDVVVPAEHAVSFYLALRKQNIPAEMHIFEPGQHGVGLAQKNPMLSIWPKLLKNWLISKKIVDPRVEVAKGKK